MKAERVSYEVMTPSAARGILEAVHWKPAIAWKIDRIHVLRPIRFETFRRNEVDAKIVPRSVNRAFRSGDLTGLGIAAASPVTRQQRGATLLKDVEYVIEAHFEMTRLAGAGDSPAKHISMFNRRAANGQCFHRPCLGTREFPAEFDLLPVSAELPDSKLPLEQRNRDLGWMLYDIDFAGDAAPHFFPARLTDGVLDVGACMAERLAP